MIEDLGTVVLVTAAIGEPGERVFYLQTQGPTGTHTVKCEKGQVAALVYIASKAGEGRARPGYIHLVVAAAREWQLPQSYIRSLARWSSSRKQRAS